METVMDVARMPWWQALIIIGVCALTTLGTRALPFLAFPPGKSTPRYIVYLGKVLPFAITTMLIVYCLKDVAIAVSPYALPEILAVALVVTLFLTLKNSLIAIAGGTVLYMILVQLVFV